MGPDRDLIDAVGVGLSAEIAIAILSPHSVPAQWDRERWEPTLLQQPEEFGSLLVIALARPCRFPELLRRKLFADFSKGTLAGNRDLKRLLIRTRTIRDPYDLPRLHDNAQTWPALLENLRLALADKPAAAFDLPREAALHFAHLNKEDFEGVFWIDCAGRTEAGILGDAAESLGLRLTGSAEQNRIALTEFCAKRRCLFLYEHLHPDHQELVTFGGRASALGIIPTAMPDVLPLAETLALFSGWALQPDRCARRLGDAYTHLVAPDISWSEQVQLGSALVAFLKQRGRFAEVNEILEKLIPAAQVHDAQDALRSFQWDQSWILGHWGEPYNVAIPPPTTSGEANQLGFNFA